MVFWFKLLDFAVFDIHHHLRYDGRILACLCYCLQLFTTVSLNQEYAQDEEGLTYSGRSINCVFQKVTFLSRFTSRKSRIMDSNLLSRLKVMPTS
jgi:hypothetical protein